MNGLILFSKRKLLLPPIWTRCCIVCVKNQKPLPEFIVMVIVIFEKQFIMAKKINNFSEARHLYIDGVGNNANIPQKAKEELKHIIAQQQFQVMNQIVGIYELLYLRETQS